MYREAPSTVGIDITRKLAGIAKAGEWVYGVNTLTIDQNGSISKNFNVEERTTA